MFLRRTAILPLTFLLVPFSRCFETLPNTSPALNLRSIGYQTCRIPPFHTFDINWRFAPSTLLHAFPVDSERRNFVRQVHDALFSLVSPTPLRRRATLVALSPDALQLLDLSTYAVLRNGRFVDVAAGNELVLGSQPSAQRYGGHQFGSWSGQLGDGRAHLLGEYVNRNGERWEVQLKGSGRTPYSRHGDGRAVLRSSVREFLASEAMHHLGIPTSRAVSMVVSGDSIMRDQFYDGHPQAEPAGVVMRLAESWLRFGSLELMHVNREFELLKTTVEFLIKQHFPSLLHSADRYEDFFSTVLRSTAQMVAHWQAVGFAHGVCNTDNFSLLSITIDYGPFGFLDRFDPGFVPNTSDDEGLYQFQRQSEAARFNLHKLWIALGTVFNDSRRPYLQLKKFDEIFDERYIALMRKKLGLLGQEDGDRMLVTRLLEMMQTMFADYSMTWRELSEASLDELIGGTFAPEMWSLPRVAEHDSWPAWLQQYVQRLQRQAVSYHDSDEQRRERMASVNPRYILRNYLAERAILQATEGDYSEVKQLHRVLQSPYRKQALAEQAGYASPPPGWSRHLRVSCSS